MVTSVVIATGKAMHKKVRSGRCFAAHYLFFPCVGFGLMVSRGGEIMLPISSVASFNFQYQSWGVLCYLPDDKIIMLLLGKYGIICASKQRSMHDAYRDRICNR